MLVGEARRRQLGYLLMDSGENCVWFARFSECIQQISNACWVENFCGLGQEGVKEMDR